MMLILKCVAVLMQNSRLKDLASVQLKRSSKTESMVIEIEIKVIGIRTY